MDLVLRPPRPDDRDWFFLTCRDAFRSYAEQAFGPWDDELHRGYADRDFATLPIATSRRCRSLAVLQVNPAQQLHARLGFRVTSVEPPRLKMEWP